MATEPTIEELTAELAIARRDATNATERAQRAEARNVILCGKDTYDLPAVLERANRLQSELDELRYERDPRNWPPVLHRFKRKAAAANKAREAAEAGLKAVEAEAARMDDDATAIHNGTMRGDMKLRAKAFRDAAKIARDIIDKAEA